jgi:phosphoserine phosphatase RsbU/P
VLHYSNAGHNPPRIKDGMSGRIVAIDGAATLPLGIMEDLEARVCEVQLKANDTLVLYTDGITEAFSPEGEQFEVHRLDASLIECSGAPDCVVDSIHKSLFAHRGSATRDDDQTIVAIRYHGVCSVDLRG